MAGLATEEELRTKDEDDGGENTEEEAPEKDKDRGDDTIEEAKDSGDTDGNEEDKVNPEDFADDDFNTRCNDEERVEDGKNEEERVGEDGDVEADAAEDNIAEEKDEEKAGEDLNSGAEDSSQESEKDEQNENDEEDQEVEKNLDSELESSELLGDQPQPNKPVDGEEFASPEEENEKVEEKERLDAFKANERPTTFGVQDSEGQDSIMPEEGQVNEQQDNKTMSNSEMHAQDMNETTSSRSDAVGGANDQRQSISDERVEENSHSKRDRRHPNPFNSPGDVNESWHRRLNMIEGIEKNENDENVNMDVDEQRGQSRDMMFDYAQAGSDQVLADSSEGVNIPDENEAEVSDDDDLRSPSQNFEEKEEVEKCSNSEEDRSLLPEESISNRKRPRSSSVTSVSETGGDGMNEDVSNGEDEDGTNEKNGGDEHMDEDALNNYMGFMQPGLKALKYQRENELDVDNHEQKSVQLLREPRDPHEDPSTSRAVWAKYKANTELFSTRLCEQLRLILEPTLATRLQGDYRTGKRINMRKIIGYVASGFRKDKIWLRRTKPAKRNYQIMIMIDDSSSMGQAGPLALSALALISSAMTRLEIGDIGVASFAEHVNVLHSLGQPFTDDSGSHLVSQFNFQAQQTNLACSLRAILPEFENSATGSSNIAQMRLCFVISDARIDSDNRESLNNLVSQMADKNILTVLLIIDKNENSKDSILLTKTVDFTENGIVTKSYLDNFPFPYFAVIQKLEALPEVLSDTLKQWFEMMRSRTNEG